MRIHGTIVSTFALILSAFAYASDAKDMPEASARTPDGRFGSRCYSWAKDVSLDLCIVPFVRLVARPEEYHDRLVSVTGYLVDVFGKPVLFANEQSYAADVNVEGIELLEASAIPESIRRKLTTGVFPVVVVGTFDARYMGIGEMRLGALKSIENVVLTVRLPGSGDAVR